MSWLLSDLQAQDKENRPRRVLRPLASHSALLAHVTPFACALAGKDFAVAWLSYPPLAGFPDEATPAKTPAVFYIPHFM
jgi:hypothetical protein